MTIKFTCSCGKRLRARDEMAARRSACPRCGAPVGIPSLQPTHPEANAGPLSPAERLRERQRRKAEPPFVPGKLSDDTAGDLADPPRIPVLEPALPPRPPLLEPIQTSRIRRRLYGWRPEKHWFECLDYPFRAWQLVVVLATSLALIGGVGTFLLPRLLEARQESPHFLFLLAPYWLVPAVVLCYGCGFLDATLNSAVAGKCGPLYWVDLAKGWALRGTAKWLFCFLPGPVVFAAGAFFYWLYCGDPDWIDVLILAELSLGAVGLWALTILSVSRTGRLLDALPPSVAALARELGGRAFVVAGLAWAVVAAHGLVAFVAVGALHKNLGAWLLLMACCGSGTFCATFLARLLGTWCRLLPAPALKAQPA
jgi:hypothetical protein